MNRAELLLEQNEEVVRAHNYAFLKKSLWVGFFISLMACVVAMFRSDMHLALSGYAFCVVAFGLLLCLMKTSLLREHPLIGLYTLFTVFFSLVLFLSCIVFPTRYAASALTFFSIVPLVFVDKQLRTDIYILSLYVLHTALAFVFKDHAIASVDMINCMISLILGMAMGQVMFKDRLESFEVSRQLKMERETDVLTKLSNRRKLFDEMSAIERGDDTPPDGVMMFDIDHFKMYNDSYGHAAGDTCLNHFGALLKTFETDYPIHFYRYGGEEFVAFVYNCQQDVLYEIAERIRTTIEKQKMGSASITVSIGVTMANGKDNINYEYWIAKADEAAYVAKEHGRNRVELATAEGSFIFQGTVTK